MKSIKLIAIAILICVSNTGWSQMEHLTHWYFGMGAGLDFSSGSPVSVGNLSLIAREGSTAYSDTSGNLLFYSNGVAGLSDTGAVWNANHQIMPNGILTDITGNASTMQTSIVVPMPGSSSEYYLFTLDGYENYGSANYKGLCYSIIDMTLDSGLGDVTDKAIPIATPAVPFLSEQLTATKHANGTDYWLVAHEGTNVSDTTSEFFVFLIDASGISAPTSIFVGTSTSPGMQSTMQISAQGDRLVYNHEVFDFDNTTGMISNPVTIGSIWGYREFSSSGRYLYSSKWNSGLYQYDLTAPNIAASEVTLSTYQDFGQIQIAPDGKMYIAMEYNLGWQPYLSVINDPENPGTACNFVMNQMNLTVGTSATGLPNFIDFVPTIDDSGLDEMASFNLTLFPNPVAEELNIYAEGKVITSIRLVDALGKEVENRDVNHTQYNYDISSLHSGMYFIEVYTESGKAVKKVQKL